MTTHPVKSVPSLRLDAVCCIMARFDVIRLAVRNARGQQQQRMATHLVRVFPCLWSVAQVSMCFSSCCCRADAVFCCPAYTTAAYGLGQYLIAVFYILQADFQPLPGLQTHPMRPADAMSICAVDYRNTPAFGVSPAVAEGFPGQGVAPHPTADLQLLPCCKHIPCALQVPCRYVLLITATRTLLYRAVMFSVTLCYIG
jgi:hypothetical protein